MKKTVGGFDLYLGDCLEIMKEMDSDSVDAVVTDPPYGIRYSPSQNSNKAWGPKTFVGDCVVHGDDEEFNPTPLAVSIFTWGIAWKLCVGS